MFHCTSSQRPECSEEKECNFSATKKKRKKLAGLGTALA